MPVKIQRIVLLGAGNTGHHLASAFRSAGLTLVQVYSRTLGHAERFSNEYHCAFTDDLYSLDKEADIYVFAIKDDAVAQLSSKIRLDGKMAVHTSGSLPPDALQSVSKQCGVLYPVQSFTLGLQINWNEVPICIEAFDSQMLDSLQSLARSISGNVVFTNYETRKRLHLAAVFVNNFTNFLMGTAEVLLKDTNLSFDILRPLAEETIRKAFQLGAFQAQTGPAIRGDGKTIDQHIESLAGHPEISALYRLFTEAITKKIKGPI